MQTNKDFNIQIFEAIKLEAQNYFNEIKEHFEPGTYNAKDLTKLIAEMSEKLQYKEITRVYKGSCYYRKKNIFLVSAKDIDNKTHEATFYNSGKQINIEIDNFKVTFDACKVFDYLTKFARVNGIREIILFTNEAKTDKEPLITFDIDIQKDALDLCKYVVKDDTRPQMEQIYISLEYFTLVASDGFILGEKQAKIYNLKGEGTPKNLFISPEALKKCVGPCKVSYYGDSTMIENSKGEQYINTINDNFPNYKCIIPKVLDSAIIPVDYNQIKTFLKNAKKNKSIHRFLITGEAGEKKVILSACEDLWEGKNKRSVSIDLKEVINISFCIAYNIDKVLNIGKFESIFLSHHERAAVVNLSSGYGILMPMIDEKAYIEANCDFFTHPFDSSAYLPSEPIVEELKEEKTLYDANFDFFMEKQIVVSHSKNNETIFFSSLNGERFLQLKGSLSDSDIKEHCFKIHSSLSYYNEKIIDSNNINYPIDYKRNVWIPKMKKSRLERLLSKRIELLTDNDKEDLLDYKYFLIFQKVDAYENGLMDTYGVSQKEADIPGCILIPKNKFWVVNINYLTEGFETKYNIPINKSTNNVTYIEPIIKPSRKESIISNLESKIESMHIENRKYDGYNHMCRTLYYSHHRKTMLNYRRIEANKTAIKILKGETFSIYDISQLYVNCFPDCDKTNEIDSELVSSLPSLNILSWIFENTLNKYLSAFKKCIFKYDFKLLYNNGFDEKIFNLNKQTPLYCSGIVLRKEVPKMEIIERVTTIENQVVLYTVQKVPIYVYIEQICILLSLNHYIASETTNIRGEAKRNNNFDCDEHMAVARKYERIDIYDARSG